MDVDAAGLEAVHSVPYRIHRHCDEVEPSDRTSIGGTNIPNGGPIFLLSAFDATRSSERGLAGGQYPTGNAADVGSAYRQDIFN